MTANRSFKQRVRARMAETGEKYTEARRAILAEGGEQAKGGRDYVTPPRKPKP